VYSRYRSSLFICGNNFDDFVFHFGFIFLFFCFLRTKVVRVRFIKRCDDVDDDERRERLILKSSHGDSRKLNPKIQPYTPHPSSLKSTLIFEYKTNFYVYDLLESFSHPGHNSLWSPNQSESQYRSSITFFNAKYLSLELTI